MSKIFKYGIDISEHQGNFDLKPYKEQFVIIRAAWGTNTDKQFENNVAKCNTLGIPYGVYLYSYALSPDTAKAEANYLLNLIKGKNIKCGVWFDMEDADGYKRDRNALGTQLISDMCKVFCSTVESAGYYTGIYASQSWFGTKIVGVDKYDKWVANWGTNSGNKETDTSSMGTMQQYTSKPIDKNVMYVDISTYTAGGSKPQPKPEPVPKPQPKKSVDTVANEIVNHANYGGWGTNPTRRQKLIDYNGVDFANKVQARIDEMVNGKAPTPVPKPPVDTFVLKNEPLYPTATSNTPVNYLTGTYYKWDSQVISGKIRITNSRDRIGKAGQVTGFIKAR